jgi:hypothetical protein
MENYVEKLHTLWPANYGKSERKGCKLRNQKKMIVLMVNKSISDHDLDAYRELLM